MRKVLLLLLFISTFEAKAQVDALFENYRTSSLFSQDLESHIFEKNVKKMLNNLENYYSDSLFQIQNRAYYLSVQLGLKNELKIQQRVVEQLCEGSTISKSEMKGSLYRWLQQFKPEAFSNKSRELLLQQLQKKQIYHFKELVLLCGYLNIGNEILSRMLLNDGELTTVQKWTIHLALARMGGKIDYCLNVLKRIDNENQKVAFLIPELLYTRRKEAVDYCLTILYSNEKNCQSVDPDVDSDIICGYRIAELLAPIIEAYPYKADPLGCLITTDYEKALEDIREWFINNPNYQINRTTF